MAGGLGDFDSLAASDPAFSSSWGTIQAQLGKENASATDVNAAKNAFATSFEQLTSVPGQDAGQALGAAQQYVMAGQTVYGAVQNVAGLIRSAQGGNPVGLVESFTGVMVGASITGGALTAGVGAAIVGAVDLVLTLLQGAGLFGSAPGTTICPGMTLKGATFAIPRFDPAGSGNACCGVISTPAQISPGAPTWRPFPDPTKDGDRPWFAPSSSVVQQFDWLGATFYFGNSAGSSIIGGGSVVGQTPPLRPIDIAFPQYHSLECMAAGLSDSSQTSRFYASFFAAWKLNAAYALNGLTPQPDANVMLQALRFWNRAHARSIGPIVTLQLTEAILPAGVALLSPSTACSSSVTPYPDMLVTSVLGQSQSTDSWVSADGKSILINAGPFLQSPGSLTVAASGMSAGKKVAIGAGLAVAVAAGAAGVYAAVTRTAFSTVLDTLGDRAVSYVSSLGAGEARERRKKRSR